MTCKNCGASVPHNAEKCNICNGSTGYSREIAVGCDVVFKNGFTDAYGEKITFLAFNKEKAKKREKYIKGLAEYKDVSRKNAKAEMPKLFVGIAIALLIFVFTMLITLGPNNGIMTIIPILIFGAIGIIFLLRKPFKKDTQEARNETRYFDVHDQKAFYYFTSNAFGFVSADERYYIGGVARFKYKWGTYEFNKHDIKHIEYNSHYKEWVIHLNRPVYHSYEEAPSCEFRIADIFNIDHLSQALGKNL